jgi:hypothetical protein
LSDSRSAISFHRVANENRVTGRQRVGQGGFPRARAGSRIDHNRSRGLENRPQIGKYFKAQRTEVRAAMIHRRVVYRAQHAIRHVRRARYLQEVATGSV